VCHWGAVPFRTYNTRQQVVSKKQRLIVQTLAYTLYGLAIFLVFLYMTFPYDLLRQRIVAQFRREDLQLAIAGLRPSFPPGVEFQQIRLLTSPATSAKALAHIDNLQAQPNFFAFATQMLDIQLAGRLYSGQLAGNARTDMGNGESPWELQAHFSDLQVEQYPFVQKDNTAFLRGRLEGDIIATLDRAGLIQQGVVNLRMQPLVFVGNEGLQLPLQREVTCDSLQSQLQFKAGQLQLVSFNCRGDDLAIQARGTIQWQQPLRASIMELHVQMRSEATFKQEIDLIGTLVHRRPDRRGTLSFSIRGTFEQPRFGA
jgi:type II secretion system protein N